MYKQARDPKFWEKVRESPDYAPFRECIQRTYEKCGKRTEIKYSEYVSYWRTGVRTGSDGAYFEREKYFNSLLFLTLIYPDKEEYLAEFQDVIWSTCNDFSWERAAHMHQPDNLEYKEIALSGATLAAKMAEACCWLEDRLDCLIKRRIIYEIKHKYLIPLKKNMYEWESAENNWACTCAGFVGIALMLLFPQEFLNVKPRIDSAMECFLRSFSKEGFCLEGVGYWSAFGTFADYAVCLREFTDGKENYFERQRVHDIALFLNYAYLRKDYGVGFSDTYPQTKCWIGTSHLLHSIYPDVKILPRQCYGMEAKELDDAIVWWEKFSTSLLNYNPAYMGLAEEAPLDMSDCYAVDAGWYIHKGSRYSLAAKAGHNDEPHNHNDVGSFHLVTDNGQQLADIGPSLYTINAFVDEYRYQVFGNSSRGHNLPIIDDTLQMYGREYCGTMLPVEQGVEIEFASAYPHKTLTACKRTLVCKDTVVELKDAFSFCGGEHTVTERFVCLQKPEITANGVKFGDVELILDIHAWNCEVSENEHINNANFGKDPIIVYAVDFTKKIGSSGEFSMHISVKE